jgi:hypothetical protein
MTPDQLRHFMDFCYTYPDTIRPANHNAVITQYQREHPAQFTGDPGREAVPNTATDPQHQAHTFLFDTCQGMTLKMTGLNEITYYNKDGQWLFQQDYNTGRLWVDHDRLMTKLRVFFPANDQHILDCITQWVATNLRWTKLTPSDGCHRSRRDIETQPQWWGSNPTKPDSVPDPKGADNYLLQRLNNLQLRIEDNWTYGTEIESNTRLVAYQNNDIRTLYYNHDEIHQVLANDYHLNYETIQTCLAQVCQTYFHWNPRLFVSVQSPDLI